MSTLRISGARLAVIVIAVAILFINARSYDASQSESRPLKLLQQSHTLSTELDPLDRASVLLTLLKNGEDIIPETQYKEWCSEMAQQARRIFDGWDRVAQEKNALVRLSKVDPIRALREYSTIEDPQPQVDGTFPEDVRADGAITIFAGAWDSQPTISTRLLILNDIEAEALRIGRTGEYPYEAMGNIIVSVHKTGSNQAKEKTQKIFRDAIHFYREEPHKFINRDEEFRRFLEATKTIIDDHDLLAEAVQVFVYKVLHSPKDMDYVSEIRTAKGITQFTDDKAELLFQEFPTVQKLAPALANELRLRDRKLDKAVLPMDDPITGGYVALDRDERQTQQMHSKIRQAQVIRNMLKSADLNVTDTKLNQALADVAELSDDAIRIQGYCALMPSLVRHGQRRLYKFIIVSVVD